ncbi:MAG: GPI inositol-deacylase, partial [Altererythrobacter sp.]|nr:GPI inositol-deacylase [Altererythrobacter sp.]
MANRKHLSDLRGAALAAFDAADSIAGIVERMHRTIQLSPGPLGRAVSDRPRGITGFVYRTVRGGIRLGGRAVDAGLAPVSALLPEGESSPKMDAYRSAVNGVYGDYLHRTGNPLAIEMSLRCQGRRALDLQGPVVANRLVVLVHGLCMNDRQWHRDGHDHGAALADELGYQPLYLRYNSGLNIANNGRAFAQLLETLISSQSSSVDELVIVGHSMGGLVARSACHHGQAANHSWPKQLRKLVFLGTPHHGAPLERGGHVLDVVLDQSPYTKPFTRIGKSRSAGITDLRHGTVDNEADSLPLPAGVKCYAAAAARAEKRSLL